MTIAIYMDEICYRRNKPAICGSPAKVDTIDVLPKALLMNPPPTPRAARPMPVFLISFNRGAMLKQAVAGIGRQSRPTEIIIHDNGSNDLETLDVLKALEESGIKIYRYPPITSADDLNQVDITVQDYFSLIGVNSNYIVSDCDIDISVSDPRAFDLYEEMLNRFSHIECVGPMLRIRDIPRSYPLFDHVMDGHIELFWRRRPDFVETSMGKVAFLECGIDTTLALHRSGEPFRRHKKAFRIYEPFEALHLDWYTQPQSDGIYYRTSNPNISHWNNKQYRMLRQKYRLLFNKFNAVRVNDEGVLEIYTEYLKDVPTVFAWLPWVRRQARLLKRGLKTIVAQALTYLSRPAWRRTPPGSVKSDPQPMERK